MLLDPIGGLNELVRTTERERDVVASKSAEVDVV